MNASRKNKAFTLIELLVVIAITSILASILLPVFTSAKTEDPQAACASNEVQIGRAFQQYTQDYDQRLPIITTTGIAAGHPQAWDEFISPYLGQKAAVGSGSKSMILNCPSNPFHSKSSLRAYSVPDAYSPSSHPGIVSAPVTIKTTPVSTCYPGIAVSKIPTPADVLELVERPALGNRVDFTSNATTGCAADSNAHRLGCQDDALPGADGSKVPVHNGGWNYLFCDGHVKWLRPEQTIGTGTVGSPKGYWTLADGD